MVDQHGQIRPRTTARLHDIIKTQESNRYEGKFLNFFQWVRAALHNDVPSFGAKLNAILGWIAAFING